MRVLIDTNVVLDVLCNRKAFVRDAAAIFRLCEVRKISGYLSALSVSNIVYILRKELNKDTIKDLLQKFTLLFEIIDLKSDDLKEAAFLDFADYEDAVQSVQAHRIKADYIITRNTKDFAASEIQAIKPDDFLKRMQTFMDTGLDRETKQE